MVDADVREFFHFAVEGRHVSDERDLLVWAAFVAIDGTLLPRTDSRCKGRTGVLSRSLARVTWLPTSPHFLLGS